MSLTNIGRQTFEIGSLWPLWGEDVCVELAFHRVALKKGIVPRTYSPPGTDPNLVFGYQCRWNSNELGKAPCTFHIRVDTETDSLGKTRRRTTEFDPSHKHHVRSYGDPKKKEAEGKIRNLEAKVQKEALLAIGKIRSGDFNPSHEELSAEEMQVHVLEDVRIAITSKAKEKVREDAIKAGTLIQRASVSQDGEEQALASASSSTIRPPDTQLDPPAVKASSSQRPALWKPVPSQPSNDSSRALSRPSGSAPVSFGSGTGVKDLAKLLARPDATTSDPFTDPFDGVDTWSTLSSFRAAIDASRFNYDQVSPPQTPEESPEAPQYSFRCSQCISSFTIVRDDSGAYHLQSELADLEHDWHPNVAKSRSSTSTALLPSQVVPLPSLKRSRDDAGLPSRSPGVVDQASNSKGKDRATSSEPSSNKRRRVESTDESTSRAASTFELPPSQASEEQDRPPSTEKQTPASISAPPSSELSGFLQKLDETGGYDFSCYYPTLRQGRIDTLKQLRVYTSSDKMVSTLMSALQKQDEAEAREAGTDEGSEEIPSGLFRRELFCDLLMSLDA